MLAHASCTSCLLCVGESFYTIRVMSSTGASEARAHISPGPQSSGTHSHHYYLLFRATRDNSLNTFM